MNGKSQRDKTFAATLNKEAKNLRAAGMEAEGTALKREASDLLSKVCSCSSCACPNGRLDLFFRSQNSVTRPLAATDTAGFQP